MKIISDIGIQIPQVYLPKAGVDLNKWAVIACDQFTSEPEYWHDVEKIVGDAPSNVWRACATDTWLKPYPTQGDSFNAPTKSCR